MGRRAQDPFPDEAPDVTAPVVLSKETTALKSYVHALFVEGPERDSVRDGRDASAPWEPEGIIDLSEDGRYRFDIHGEQYFTWRGRTMSTKKIQEKIVDNMRRWQKIENASVVSTGKVMERTKNPLVRLVMEIIQRDSQMHYHVQEFIVESLESKAISLTPEELKDVWTMIEEHIKLEETSVELAEEALQALRGRKLVAQEYLLDYLRLDEQKHDKILENLSTIKKGMYPYG
jgi:hypothetical protein